MSNQEDAAVQIIAQAMGQDEDNSSPSSSAEKYQFDEDFQRKIAALCLRNPSFARRTEGLVEPDYFESEAQGFLVDAANRYFSQYRCLPDSTSVFVHYLKKRMQETRIRKDFREEVVAEYKALSKETVNDADFVAQEVGDFAKTQAFKNAMIKSIDLIDEGKTAEIESLMKKAMQVGALDNLNEIDFWNDIESRSERRKEILAGNIERRGIPTGIKKIDNLLYHRGWGRKEMTVFMAGAKKGKSMTLAHFSILGAMAGFNAIYVTLEVANEIIADRMDANITNTKMKDLTAEYQEVADSIELNSTAKRGHLKLVEAPSGSLSPAGLRRILERYKADGIQFDLIVVDYADIMRPDMMTQSEIENSKQVWLGLRAIAFEEDAAMLTATQTNRTGFKAETAKAEDAAEDFNKIRIADLVISINATDDEKSKNKARLYFAASRNQQGEFTLNIEQDLSSARAITKVGGITA